MLLLTLYFVQDILIYISVRSPYLAYYSKVMFKRFFFCFFFFCRFNEKDCNNKILTGAKLSFWALLGCNFYLVWLRL